MSVIDIACFCVIFGFWVHAVFNSLRLCYQYQCSLLPGKIVSEITCYVSSAMCLTCHSTDNRLFRVITGTWLGLEWYHHCCWYRKNSNWPIPTPDTNGACKLFNIRLYATLCFNYFWRHRCMFSYGSVFELLICSLRNAVFNLLLSELYPRENEVIPEVRKRRGGWPGFEVFVWRRLMSCWILSAVSPEIQEWSHKSRSRINNLYLLTLILIPAY